MHFLLKLIKLILLIFFVLTNSLLKLLDDYDTIKNIKKYLYVLENYQII